ncbi:hypothetical protein MAC_04486 [Metarhizium acridum CQMa 102]|uniref:Xylanolytic transcriptional activator regulatory domain-containing protein n=1 Tax=Metarhizium acridum (strain CQMa 102) TaxID=655827 RepID=E9E3P2_METAQ|nr:uncharacterized protein MAC_04486 [Metarhizium acridum CQMa 102]EFY89467.1 hypothetical protein MAC_04486 [Metarhizium acridum CQMa 102]
MTPISYNQRQQLNMKQPGPQMPATASPKEPKMHRAAQIHTSADTAKTAGEGDLTSMTQTNQNDSPTSWNSANASRRPHAQPNVQATEQTESHNIAVQDDQLDQSISESPDAAPLTNPLSTGPSTFMLSDTGKTFYLGHSSNWSFTRRILSITYEHVHQVSLPSTALMFDSKVYILDWSSASAQPVLPNLDYAIHLINNVKFHCSPMYHLFDEEVFLNALHAHYSGEQTQGDLVQQLWFIQFMLILAFGKALTTKPNKNNQPPGAIFFTHAIHLLPNMTVLWDEPVQAAEILCCIALYLHCIEHRGSAYNYIGQAVRLAMSHGLHTNLSSHHVENALVPRCRKIWWTILVLDRQMTYLMGLSQSIRDDDVTAPLPEFEGDRFRTAAFAMRTKLSHFIATIDRETFLSYDLEALFISMTNLLAAPVLYLDSGSTWTSWRQRAYAILGEISKCGNLIAQYQQYELQHLEKMIDGLCMTETTEPAPPSRHHATDVSAVANDTPLAHGAGFSVAEDALPSPVTDDVLDGNYTGAGFSTAQIMDMVNSIDTEHGEWMSQAFMEA